MNLATYGLALVAFAAAQQKAESALPSLRARLADGLDRVRQAASAAIEAIEASANADRR